MNDLAIVHILSTTRRRGAEAFAEALIPLLPHRQNVVILEKTPLEIGFPVGLEPMYLGDSTRLKFSQLLGLRRWLKANPVDVIYCHGMQANKYAVLASKGMIRRPKIVHRKIGFTLPWISRFKAIRVAMARYFLKQSDMTLFLGSGQRKELMDVFGVSESRLRQVANYRSVTPYQMCEPEKREAKAEPVVVMVGALSQEKNLSFALRMLQRALSEGLNFKLKLVGKGPLESELQTLAATLDVASHVVWTGFCRDVASELYRSDIFLLCSHTEGVPGAAIEAGFAGLPVVAWAVGDIAAVVTKSTGVLTPFGDEEALYQELKELLLDSKQRQSMGLAARTYCLQNFSPENLVAAHQQLFENLMQGES